MFNRLADVLTFFRLVSSVALVVLILCGQWQFAMALFILAILSDAFDGIAARKWSPRDAWYRKDPHAFDNAADGALSVLVMAALVVRFFMGWINDGPESSLFVGWLAAAIATILVTGIFLFLVAELVPSSAEPVDVVHGFVYGTLLVAMLLQITILAVNDIFGWVVLYLVAILAISVYKWDRLTSRPEVTYTGTKTWKQLLIP